MSLLTEIRLNDMKKENILIFIKHQFLFSFPAVHYQINF